MDFFQFFSFEIHVYIEVSGALSSWAGVQFRLEFSIANKREIRKILHVWKTKPVNRRNGVNFCCEKMWMVRSRLVDNWTLEICCTMCRTIIIIQRWIITRYFNIFLFIYFSRKIHTQRSDSELSWIKDRPFVHGFCASNRLNKIEMKKRKGDDQTRCNTHTHMLLSLTYFIADE